MKTVLEELIERLDWSIKNTKGDYKIHFGWTQTYAKSLLEKEKEQIDNAFEAGYNDCLSDKEKFKSGKGYYNEIYIKSKDITPKEQAFMLMMKYRNIEFENGQENSFTMISLKDAKKCALLGLNEIIKALPPCDYGLEFELKQNYWQEVKKEIEGL